MQKVSRNRKADLISKKYYGRKYLNTQPQNDTPTFTPRVSEEKVKIICYFFLAYFFVYFLSLCMNQNLDLK